MKKTVSDLISNDDIFSWKPGEVYGIQAYTSQGKSYFCQNKLYDFCKEHNKKICILTNRTILSAQIRFEIKDKDIPVISYQRIEKEKVNQEFHEIYPPFPQEEGYIALEEFDYICMDECHYFFSDFEFNKYCDTVLEMIPNLKNSIILLISATPQFVFSYLKESIKKIYLLKGDYSYIENVYYYRNKEHVERIIKEIPADEKVLFFGSNKNRLKELLAAIPHSAMIHRNNKAKIKALKDGKKEIVYNPVVENIIQKSTLTVDRLFTTTVLDNGINIKDISVKHIFIEIIDAVDFIQCLGRKRIVGNEKINLYFYNPDLRTFYGCMKMYEDVVELISQYHLIGKDAFLKVNNRNNISKAFDNGGNLIPVLQKRSELYYDYYLSIYYDGKNGFLKKIAELLDKKVEEFKNIEDEKDKQIIEEISNKYLGKKLYLESLKDFKSELLSKTYNPLTENRKGISYSTINRKYKDYDIPLQIKSDRMKTKDKRDITFWVISGYG